jgi:hypothetical protein
VSGTNCGGCLQRRTLEWREANRVDELAGDASPAYLKRAALFRELWPSEVYGVGAVYSFPQPTAHRQPYSSVPIRQPPYDHRSERAATEAMAVRKAGNPILVIRVGKVKPQALAAAFALEEFQLFFARDIEVREPAGVFLACETFHR